MQLKEVSSTVIYICNLHHIYNIKTIVFFCEQQILPGHIGVGPLCIYVYIYSQAIIDTKVNIEVNARLMVANITMFPIITPQPYKYYL